MNKLDFRNRAWLCRRPIEMGPGAMYEQYPHHIGFMFEEFYDRYHGGELEFKQIPVPGGRVVDLQYLVEIDIKDPRKQYRVMRSLNLSDRARPNTNFRWNNANLLRPKNSLHWESGKINWLGKQWMELTGMELPTLLDILKGIQEEEKIY